MSFTLFAVILAALFIDYTKSNINSTQGVTSSTDSTKEDLQINFANETVVSETHHAICSIKTEEVVAKAQSTASRILNGVCTSDEMMKAFKNIEKIFTERLEQFQQSLLTMIESKLQPNAQKSRNYKTSRSSAFKAVDYIFDENIFKNYT